MRRLETNRTSAAMMAAMAAVDNELPMAGLLWEAMPSAGGKDRKATSLKAVRSTHGSHVAGPLDGPIDAFLLSLLACGPGAVTSRANRQAILASAANRISTARARG